MLILSIQSIYIGEYIKLCNSNTSHNTEHYISPGNFPIPLSSQSEIPHIEVFIILMIFFHPGLALQVLEFHTNGIIQYALLFCKASQVFFVCFFFPVYTKATDFFIFGGIYWFSLQNGTMNLAKPSHSHQKPVIELSQGHLTSLCN